MTKKLVACALALLISLTATFSARAVEFDPSGRYQAENKESRYDVTLCGDGTAVCALLYWIQPDKISERNKPYLGTYLFNQASQVRPVEWRGKANVLGHEVDGKIKLVSEKEMLVTACLFILCESYKLYRLTEDELTNEDPAGLAPAAQ